MNKMVVLGLRVLAFMLFAWLAQRFFSFNEIDMCFDLGGAVENNVCVGGRHGQWALVAQGSYFSWLVSLAIPALVCVGVYAFILAAGRRLSGK